MLDQSTERLAIKPRRCRRRVRLNGPTSPPLFLLSDHSFRQGMPLTHFLTILRRPYHDVSLYLAYSFTCARQSAVAFFKASALLLFAALAPDETNSKPHRIVTEIKTIRNRWMANKLSCLSDGSSSLCSRSFIVLTGAREPFRMEVTLAQQTHNDY